MFPFPKVKKTLTGPLSPNCIKKMIAAGVLTTGLIVVGVAMPTDTFAASATITTDAGAAKPRAQQGSSESQPLETGALVLTPPTGELKKTNGHGAHSSHYSHASSRY